MHMWEKDNNGARGMYTGKEERAFSRLLTLEFTMHIHSLMSNNQMSGLGM